MTTALILLGLLAALAAAWWLRRGWRECAACFRELSEFNYPNLGDNDDR